MKYTYISVLSTDSYLEGALIVNEALKRVNSKYPYTVVVTKGVSNESEDILNKNGIRTIRKNQRIMMDLEHQKNNEAGGYKYWNYTFDSLFVFDMIQFNKVVFLDCDILPLINLDHLFNCPHMSACIDPGTTDLSSGIMVIEPKEGELKRILSVVPNVLKNKSYFGDQNILQEYYKEWPKQKEKHLKEIYNVYSIYISYFVSLGYTYRAEGDNNIAVVHFFGSRKPWMLTEEEDKKLRDEYVARNNLHEIDALNYMKELLKSAKR